MNTQVKTTVERARGAAAPALAQEPYTIAAALSAGETPPAVHGATFELTVHTQAVAKQRPRLAAATNAVYTPPETVKFEKAVKAAALEKKQKLRLTTMSRPLTAHIVVTEVIPQSWGIVMAALAKANIIFPERCDVDNQVKAILDAMNGVIFFDDRQITQIFVSRRFGAAASFTVSLSEVGLSRHEALMVERIYKASEAAKRKAKK